jgi:predicted transcriptional regulator
MQKLMNLKEDSWEVNMRKLEANQIEEIKKLHKEGVSSYKLAIQFGISQGAVCYHLSEKKKERTDKVKEYQREYHKKRYQTDEEFKANQIAATIKSRKMKGGKK